MLFKRLLEIIHRWWNSFEWNPMFRQLIQPFMDQCNIYDWPKTVPVWLQPKTACFHAIVNMFKYNFLWQNFMKMRSLIGLKENFVREDAELSESFRSNGCLWIDWVLNMIFLLLPESSRHQVWCQASRQDCSHSLYPALLNCTFELSPLKLHICTQPSWTAHLFSALLNCTFVLRQYVRSCNESSPKVGQKWEW